MYKKSYTDTFKERFKKAREAKGLTQVQLAEQLPGAVESWRQKISHCENGSIPKVADLI